jgi:hypothetical protein
MFATSLMGIKMNRLQVDDETLEQQYWRLMLASQGKPMVMMPADVIPE